MIPIPVADFAAQCRGTLAGAEGYIRGFATDSRDVKPSDLFIAIRGANVDGHAYAVQALDRGAKAVLVERPIPGPSILVENVVEALARFGRSQRSRFHGPVVGVTGSAGKTTTKEMIAAALASMGPVLKSEGNRNTEYTSPLAWAELVPAHRSAVIEMGMRGFGHIAHLAGISHPTVAVITMVGTAHIEMVGSRQGIAKAKGEILESLPADGAAVLWYEDEFREDLSRLTSARCVTFGFGHGADCRVIGYQALDWSRSLIKGSVFGTPWQAELPILGRHHARNAAAAILAAVMAGAKPEEAAAKMEQASLPPMRMEAARCNGATLLLDFYNASPDSTVAALHALGEVPCRGRRLAVLGEMRELGDFTERGHRQVGQALAESAADHAYLCGGATTFIADEAAGRGFPAGHITSREVLNMDEVREFLAGIRDGDVVLIKGSRALGLEQSLPEGLERE